MNIREAFPRRAPDAPDIPIPKIVGQLTGNIAALCEYLLPNGRRDGPEWRCGSVQGEPGKSLGIHLAGAKAGIWSDFADGSKGDALDLIQACLGLDKGGAVLWAKDWLGIGDGTRAPLQPRPRLQHSEAPRQNNPNGTLALDIWNRSQPAAGTPVEAYLRHRGINIPAPATLRYNPAVKYTQSGLYLPCMVAAVQAPDRSVTAIHRTYIRDDGQGKAGVAKPKMMLGPIGGGAVRLAPVAAELLVCEGIETGLTVLEATSKSVWVCLSAGGLKSVVLPPEVETVIITADGDERGEKAAREAAGRFFAEGRKVKIAYPPKGMDFNDLAQLPENVAVISDQRRREKVDG